MTEPDDRGVQLERTSLAWTRTGLAAFAVGVLHLRVGLAASGGSVDAVGLGGVGLIVGGFVATAGARRRYRWLVGHRHDVSGIAGTHVLLSTRAARAIVAGICALSITVGALAT